MITPVSYNFGLWPSLSDFFEPADSSGISFLPQDSSWEKYAAPALQAARLFSPGLDVALAAGEVLGTAYSGISDSSSDHSESHWGRNLLIVAGLGVGLCLGWKYWNSVFKKGEVLKIPPQQLPKVPSGAEQTFVSFFGGMVHVDGNHPGISELMRDVPDQLLLDLLSRVERSKYLWIKTGTGSRLVIFGDQITHADMLVRAVKHDNPVSSLRAAGYMAVTREEIGNIATKTKIAINGRSASFSTGQNGFWITDESRLETQGAGLSGIDTFIQVIFGKSIQVDILPDATANLMLRSAGLN